MSDSRVVPLLNGHSGAAGDPGATTAPRRHVTLAVSNNTAATSNIAASVSIEELAHSQETGTLHGDLVKKLIKLDINLLLEEAWKLDVKNIAEAQKLHTIRREIVRLIEIAYGHRNPDANMPNDLSSNHRPNMAVEDYVEFARDYFDVSERTARKMFEKADWDQDGQLGSDELNHAFEPLFHHHATLKQLFSNGVKASMASQVLLFASTSAIDETDIIGMVYLVLDLGIFLYGNFLLMCITTLLSINTFFLFVDGSTLGLLLYALQSAIYVVYCVVYWRYFRGDWWTTVGLWLYTVGYLAFTYYYYVACAVGIGGIAALLFEEQAEIVGFLLFSVGSIPFCFALVPNGEKGAVASIPLKYDHHNASARGGVLFLAGSILFLISIFGSSDLSSEQSTILVAAAYSVYVWGRVEFFIGSAFNTRDTADTLAAAVTWSKQTTGIHLRSPTMTERLVHLIRGKRRDLATD